MIIKIKDIVGNRATDIKQSDIVHDMILQQFQKEEKVVLDFEGMDTILPSFLSNAICRLYKDFSEEYLNANLILKNLEEVYLYILQQMIKVAKTYYKTIERHYSTEEK